MRLWFYRLAGAATALCLCLVVIGAWVRLTDAGLGCPDWPGCYGHLTVPEAEHERAVAEARFPERPVDVGKAWREMVHRYIAGILGLMVLGLAVMAVANRRDPDQPVALPVGILALIILQSALGMWTVTLLLKPLIVLLHLIGGMTTLALLYLLWRTRGRSSRPGPKPLGAAAIAAIAVIGVQIALGGWTSTNYAALACPDFPTCQTQWWPEHMDFAEGFTPWRGLGIDYEGGVLDNPARTAIHMTHRVGAIVVLLAIGWIGLSALRRPERPVQTAGGLMLAALAAQLTIGAVIVLLHLPLSLATAHNGMAALLLLSAINLAVVTRTEPG